eukprot:Gb_19388 [translate_table: standard]
MQNEKSTRGLSPTSRSKRRVRTGDKTQNVLSNNTTYLYWSTLPNVNHQNLTALRKLWSRWQERLIHFIFLRNIGFGYVMKDHRELLHALRARCNEENAQKTVPFAPYFPPDNPNKFAVVHRMFGASNVLKLLQDLPIEQRGEAMNSMVYEATARLRDPVYGCAGSICRLQQQFSDLQSQLATAQADLLNMRLQLANLLSFFSNDQHTFHPTHATSHVHHEYGVDEQYALPDQDEDPLKIWEPLWT